MNILMTGAGGFLGSAIIKELHERPDITKIVSFARSHHSHLLQYQKVEQVSGDLRNRNRVREVFKQNFPFDAVIHVAATTDMWGKWNHFYQTNVVGTQNILEIAREFKVKKFIYTSSPSCVFGREDLINADESTP